MEWTRNCQFLDHFNMILFLQETAYFPSVFAFLHFSKAVTVKNAHFSLFFQWKDCGYRAGCNLLFFSPWGFGPTYMPRGTIDRKLSPESCQADLFRRALIFLSICFQRGSAHRNCHNLVSIVLSWHRWQDHY